MPIVDQMASGETPTHARLGIQVGDAQTGDAAGAVVREVTSGSTAEKAGLGSGAVITKVDDHRDHRRRLPRRHDPLLPPR